MSKLSPIYFIFLLAIAVLFSACSPFNPPFNDFQKPKRFRTWFQPTRKSIIQELETQDIQYIEYGDTMTLLVPTDHYFLKNSAEINDICYAALNNIVKLLQLYPKSHIYVAAFTDDMGTRHEKKYITEARAQAMVTFLWANWIPAKHLTGKGYRDFFPIGNNDYIHASAFNRRIEIQWYKREGKAMDMKAAQKYYGMK